MQNIKELSPEKQHRILVELLNQLYPGYFIKRNGFVFSNEIHKKIEQSEAHKMAILMSRIFNLQGASVGNIDLYKLLDAYLLDLPKREEINKIIYKLD